MKIVDYDQPLFVVKIGGKDGHLPPEFCLMDGVPECIRNDPFQMRNILSNCRKNPAKKISDI